MVLSSLAPAPSLVFHPPFRAGTPVLATGQGAPDDRRVFPARPWPEGLEPTSGATYADWAVVNPFLAAPCGGRVEVLAGGCDASALGAGRRVGSLFPR